jgi:hypothetical protein
LGWGNPPNIYFAKQKIMNWIKVIFTGLIAWAIPFFFNVFLFPELPSGIHFIIYLLCASIMLIELSNNVMSGYLRKRHKITMWSGASIGIFWFLISFFSAGFYYLTIVEIHLYEYSLNIGCIYLMYPIIGVMIGVCEEQRGRRR